MSLDTQLPEGQERSSRLTSPDLRLRESKTLWGPLQITVHTHREGADLGYDAGEEAYQEAAQRLGHGFTSSDILDRLMHAYLALPRYRPRQITATIVTEWRALFLLGWTSQLLEALARQDTSPFASGPQVPSQTIPTPEPSTRALTNQSTRYERERRQR